MLDAFFAFMKGGIKTFLSTTYVYIYIYIYKYMKDMNGVISSYLLKNDRKIHYMT